MQREIRIHGQLQHEHIIQLYGAFEDAEHVYLALEYAGGAQELGSRNDACQSPRVLSAGDCTGAAIVVQNAEELTKQQSVLQEATCTRS